MFPMRQWNSRSSERARSFGPKPRTETSSSLSTSQSTSSQQLRRAKEKRVDGRQHPRGAHFEKGSGSLEGIDVEPASAEVLHAVATGAVPIQDDEEEAYSPVVIRTKNFDAEWMTVEEAVDRMELVGHDFFLFVDVRTDHPSVVYRRKGWDYGVISLTAQAPPAEALAS